MGKGIFLLHCASSLTFAESQVTTRAVWQLSIHSESWHLSVCANVRVCTQWSCGQVWQADLHMLPERVCGPVLPVITRAAWSPGAPAWPGHWPARNNRDWQEGNEGSHGGREEEEGTQGHMTGGLVEGWRQESEEEREIYYREESSEDNDEGASGSIKEQREDKREGR